MITRELLMNAIMHRDYESNAPVAFYEYDDRIEIQNAGGLYGKVSANNFPNVSDYRNPFIAEAMKVLGYVNRFSRGVYRVQKELEENGNGKASFDFSLITAFKVVEPISTTYFEEGFGEEESDNKSGESTDKTPNKSGELPNKSEGLPNKSGGTTQETTQERILVAIQAKPKITQKELAQSIGLTLNGIKYHIKNMTKLGIIKHEGSTKSGKWIIIK